MEISDGSMCYKDSGEFYFYLKRGTWLSRESKWQETKSSYIKDGMLDGVVLIQVGHVKKKYMNEKREK